MHEAGDRGRRVKRYQTNHVIIFGNMIRPFMAKKILLISLSNIGDVILTFPVFDSLCERFPGAEISVVIGAKAQNLFMNNLRIGRLYVFEKRASLKDKWRWLKELRKEKFDVVVDLRNSMLPFLVRGRKRTRPVLARERRGHKKDEHFLRLKLVVPDAVLAAKRHAIIPDKEDEAVVRVTLLGVREYVVVAPGAADQRKRWPQERFARLIMHLTKERNKRVVVIGDKRDGREAMSMFRSLPGGVINTCGLLTLRQLSLVLKGASLAITNDSGVMHLSSYLDIPTVSCFGPTDPSLYGPWSSRSVAIRRGLEMSAISVHDVCEITDSFLLE